MSSLPFGTVQFSSSALLAFISSLEHKVDPFKGYKVLGVPALAKPFDK